jgi:hypothetical protein
MSIGRFVEQGPVPRDAQVVGMTWQYPKNDGGPDHRYSYSRQWPVMSVAYATFHSSAGLYLILQASDVATAQAFAHTLQTYQPLSISNGPTTSQTTDSKGH